MSRRKQAKPQHLKSDEETLQTDVASENALSEGMEEEEENVSRGSSEETHVCEKCCAEFFRFAELCEHQSGCTETEDPPVLIVKEDEGMPVTEDTSPAGPSPAPSVAPSLAPSDSADVEFTDAAGRDLGADNDSTDILGEISTNAERGAEPMDVEERSQQDLRLHLHLHQQHHHHRPPSPQSTEPPPSQTSSGVTCHSMPSSTNVTLEILHNTRVAVAQFSQVIHSGGGGGGGGKTATSAIPVILEHLLALQQQQVHQLQLIEQIRSQVAVINRQPTQTALNPVSRALSLAPNPFPSQGLVAPSVLPLSGTMPSAVNGQAASVSLASMLERSQTLSSSQSECGQTSTRDIRCTSASSDYRSPPPPSKYSSMSTILNPYTGNTHSMSVSCTQTSLRSTSSPVRLSLGQSGILLSPPSSSSLPFLPHSPPSPPSSSSSSSTVIFPNPLASITAAADALDPLAALIKQHRKGKLPNVSMFDTKPGPEEPFFKHKCRFCAKVFGSDSALQIHLRSHTGERPFKCNICGNRFSTKGNLKVHFQRHKEKYPHVQMNPYPVPEYLDNVPTSSGIPYGMSFPPEKPGATWLDSKPVLATLPTSMGLQLPSALSGTGSSIGGSLSVTPSIKSPYRPSPASSECLSISPDTMSNEPILPNASEPPQSHRERGVSHVLKAEIQLPQNCIAKPRATPPATVANSAAMTNNASITTTPTTPPTPTPTTPEPSAPTSPVLNPVTSPHLLASSTDPFQVDFPFGGLLQTSETSKLQQLVENIDKKITDPNQCLLCHRVLSCQSALKMHYRVHTGERPFKCRVCGRAFTTKGNLKTHISVHRANPPLRVQHSCPICQKKFTNAVVLQQHVHMHMGGQLPDSPLLTDGCAPRGSMDADLPLDQGNFDSLSNYENDLMCDDNSMGEEEDGEVDDGDEEEVEEDETENMEGGGFDPFKPLISSPCSPPRSSAVVSGIAALENQMRMIDSSVGLNHSFGLKSIMNGFMDRERSALGSSSTVIDVEMENHKAVSPAVSESSTSTSTSTSMPVPASPARSLPEGHHHHHHHHRSPSANHRTESQEMTASVKRERSDSPNPATLENGVPQELRGTLSNKPCVKEESPFSMLFLGRERDVDQRRLVEVEIGGWAHCIAWNGMRNGGSQHVPNMATSSAQGVIKTEVNGHHNQPILLNERLHSLPFSLQMPAAPPPLGGPGLTSLLGPPLPRRTPKQHNCHACGKNFSSASALQIHERTHTGEKPFGCSICGRAFTTKGNLKVHMGTHMWNNAPARRGRRLSIENPMALLGGDAMKFGEMFQKDLAARAMNVDPGFWNRYAAAITNGLAMKNNEISVIQNGGLPQIHAMSTGRDRGVNVGGSPPMTGLGKAGMELGVNRHFSMLIDDSKEIGIN